MSQDSGAVAGYSKHDDRCTSYACQNSAGEKHRAGFFEKLPDEPGENHAAGAYAYKKPAGHFARAGGKWLQVG